jgi:transcriptional regulator with XRE-family HTH domain
MKPETRNRLVPGWNDNIRAEAARRNLSMQRVAEIFEVSFDTVSKVFRGGNDASFELAFLISECFGSEFLAGRKNATDKKIIYVASPYSGDVQANININSAYCRGVMAEGHLPASPHLALAFVDEDTERDAALDYCKNLIDICDEVRFYIENGKSAGMIEEEKYAREIGKPVIFVG